LKEIKVGDFTAQVDDADHEWLSNFTWRPVVKNGGIYPVARVTMSHLIVGRQKGEVVDHINRDPLDNRRTNLRRCSYAENMANTGLSKRNTSGYKGVTRQDNSKKNPWRAMIWLHKRGEGNTSTHLGDFRTARLAALAYDVAAFFKNPDHAWLNSEQAGWDSHISVGPTVAECG
jgi:hypothetical protein